MQRTPLSRPRPSDNYLLHVSRVEEVFWKPSALRSKRPSMYVKFVVGQDTRKSRIVEKSLTPKWKEDIALPASVGEASLIRIHVFHSSRSKDVLVGGAAAVVSTLLDLCKEGETRITLVSPAQLPVGFLWMRLTKVKAAVHRLTERKNARRDVEATRDTGAAHVMDIVEAVGGIHEGHVGIYDDTGDLSQKLDAIKAVVNGVAKIVSHLADLLRDSDDYD